MNIFLIGSLCAICVLYEFVFCFKYFQLRVEALYLNRHNLNSVDTMNDCNFFVCKIAFDIHNIETPFAAWNHGKFLQLHFNQCQIFGEWKNIIKKKTIKCYLFFLLIGSCSIHSSSAANVTSFHVLDISTIYSNLYFEWIHNRFMEWRKFWCTRRACCITIHSTVGAYSTIGWPSMNSKRFTKR